MSDTSELAARQALGSRRRTTQSMQHASSRWSGEGSRISETRHRAQLLLKRLAIVLAYALALLVCLVLLLVYVATVLPAKRCDSKVLAGNAKVSSRFCLNTEYRCRLLHSTYCFILTKCSNKMLVGDAATQPTTTFETKPTHKSS